MSTGRSGPALASLSWRGDGVPHLTLHHPHAIDATRPREQQPLRRRVDGVKDGTPRANRSRGRAAAAAARTDQNPAPCSRAPARAAARRGCRRSRTSRCAAAAADLVEAQRARHTGSLLRKRAAAATRAARARRAPNEFAGRRRAGRGSRSLMLKTTPAPAIWARARPGPSRSVSFPWTKRRRARRPRGRTTMKAR